MSIILSIIIPTFNCEQYISRAIDSCITIKQNTTEIIIVDDASTDNTSSICDRYCKMYNNIIYHKLIKHQGVSVARNIGITLSGGKYLLFLDSDDKLNNHAINNIVCSLVNTKTDLLITGYKTISNSVHNYSPIHKYCSSLKDFLLCANEYNACSTIRFGTLWGKAYKKELINNKFYENVDFGEDTLFNIHYYDRITNCLVENYITYIHIDCNPNSLSKKQIKDIEPFYNKILKCYIDLFTNNGLNSNDSFIIQQREKAKQLIEKQRNKNDK